MPQAHTLIRTSQTLKTRRVVTVRRLVPCPACKRSALSTTGERCNHRLTDLRCPPSRRTETGSGLPGARGSQSRRAPSWPFPAQHPVQKADFPRVPASERGGHAPGRRPPRPLLPAGFPGPARPLAHHRSEGAPGRGPTQACRLRTHRHLRVGRRQTAALGARPGSAPGTWK